MLAFIEIFSGEKIFNSFSSTVLFFVLTVVKGTESFQRNQS